MSVTVLFLSFLLYFRPFLLPLSLQTAVFSRTTRHYMVWKLPFRDVGSANGALLCAVGTDIGVHDHLLKGELEVAEGTELRLQFTALHV